MLVKRKTSAFSMRRSTSSLGIFPVNLIYDSNFFSRMSALNSPIIGPSPMIVISKSTSFLSTLSAISIAITGHFLEINPPTHRTSQLPPSSRTFALSPETSYPVSNIISTSPPRTLSSNFAVSTFAPKTRSALLR